jgi:hypothetical protein
MRVEEEEEEEGKKSKGQRGKGAKGERGKGRRNLCFFSSQPPLYLQYTVSYTIRYIYIYKKKSKAD